jgi:hypothetical protein
MGTQNPKMLLISILLKAINAAVTIVHQNPSILKPSTILSVTQRKNALITNLNKPSVRKIRGKAKMEKIHPRKKLSRLYTKATIRAVKKFFMCTVGKSLEMIKMIADNERILSILFMNASSRGDTISRIKILCHSFLQHW